MLNLGYCPGCTASFPSPIVTDRLCPTCQAEEDCHQVAEDEVAYIDDEPHKYSRAAMRERLGVSGNVDE